jgi:diguanylate cyclase (GGDEF)-like protein
MAGEVNKHLEKAKKSLERNKLVEAAEAYQAALSEAPSNQEALQGLGDIYTRLGHPDRAATYYGVLFERLCDTRDDHKALVLYTRALKGAQQPPERMARYALLLQKQGRSGEAIEQYAAASELLLARGKREAALDCLERVAQLEPESAARQFAAGQLAESLGKNVIAVRAFLRAAQLSEAGGDANAALALLERAQVLAPADRSPALLYAQALLRRGEAAKALSLLEPHAATESDVTFLNTMAEALTASGELDRARGVLERMLPQDPATLSKLFDLARRHLERQEDEKAVALLRRLQELAVAARRENDFATRLEGLTGSYARSPALGEFCAAVYAALNRESSYFDALVRLFDIYIETGDVGRAGEALDKLVEIDPYDHGNQKRLGQIEASGEPALVGRIRARLAQVGTHSPQPAGADPAEEIAMPPDDPEEQQALEDLMVQAEIFMQYSLQAKAIERLQKIAELFPGEEERNTRLRGLYQMANWWPAGAVAARQKTQAASVPVRPAAAVVDSADTLRDLAKISEISQSLHRQPSARAMLSTAIQEVGKYLRATRCFAVVGAAGRPPQMASEYCAPGVEPAPGNLLVRLLGQLEQATPDGMGGLLVQQQAAPVLGELGLDSALGVPVVDPETRAQAGVMVAGYAAAHNWRPHEKYFLQAVGDQMLLGVSHARLRAMARNLGAADEKTGLLARSSYQDCLIQETQRAKSQGTTLALAVVQMDHGLELLRQHGEGPMERYMEQLARTLQPMTRQSDVAIKYTSWAIAFILPDTPLAGAESHAEKLRQAGAAVRPPWEGPPVALSASVAEAVAQVDYDSEDIVTELINRAEAGLDEARRRGGSTVVALSALSAQRT